MKKIMLYIALIFPVLAVAQSRATQGGLSMSYEGEKDLAEFTYRRPISLGVEEELRFLGNNNPVGFDRSVTSVGLNYPLIPGRLKAGLYYAFIYLWNGDYHYEARNRFYFNLIYKQPLDRQWDVSWRGRVQSTIRDESRGIYRINPRYVLKNKFEVSYHQMGARWGESLSCDFSTNLNDYETHYDFVRLRIQACTTYKFNLTNSIDLFVRWDEYLKYDDPRVIYLGASYKMKF
ncbi:MAG: DUF2490 domain-containing protein [Dysgonamonadaceae bacterium]|jgi:hypothetical protein|nr:DUF2490 domain-containing protein [Dysgonamonadaceae bacterium]